MIFRCKLDNGRDVSVEASSGADAIQSALDEYRGRTVSECWRTDGQSVVKYDIPPHKALPPKDKTKPAVDNTASMFDEAEIRLESERAYRLTAPQSEDA